MKGFMCKKRDRRIGNRTSKCFKLFLSLPNTVSLDYKVHCYWYQDEKMLNKAQKLLMKDTPCCSRTNNGKSVDVETDYSVTHEEAFMHYCFILFL